jgi:hypothetical protein
MHMMYGSEANFKAEQFSINIFRREKKIVSLKWMYLLTFPVFTIFFTTCNNLQEGKTERTHTIAGNF